MLNKIVMLTSFCLLVCATEVDSEGLEGNANYTRLPGWTVENQIQQNPALRATIQTAPPLQSDATKFDSRNSAPALQVFEPFGPSEHLCKTDGGKESYQISWTPWHQRLAAFVANRMSQIYRQYGQPGGACTIHLYVARNHRLLAVLDQTSPSNKGDFNGFVLAAYSAANGDGILEYPASSHRQNFDYTTTFECFNEDSRLFKTNGLNDLERGFRQW
jgi:hypothetical protein